MNWRDMAIVGVGVWVGVDQSIAFWKAQRSGVTYGGRAEKTPILKAENPGLFWRNAGSKGIMAVVMAVGVGFILYTDLRPN